MVVSGRDRRTVGEDLGKTLCLGSDGIAAVSYVGETDEGPVAVQELCETMFADPSCTDPYQDCCMDIDCSALLAGEDTVFNSCDDTGDDGEEEEVVCDAFLGNPGDGLATPPQLVVVEEGNVPTMDGSIMETIGGSAGSTSETTLETTL